MEPLWASGPGEILRHGVSLLGTDTDSNRRLAMISIDNAVELMMQTYIQLPRRITGVDLSSFTIDGINLFVVGAVGVSFIRHWNSLFAGLAM